MITRRGYNSRPKGNQTEDIPVLSAGGFFDMFMGLFFVFYGGVCYDLFSDFTTDFPHMPFILFFVFLSVILEALRRRITYPPIGRAKITEEFRPWYSFLVIVPLAVLPALYAALRFFSDTLDINVLVTWPPALFGIVLVGLFHDRASKTGSNSYYVFAVLALVSGFITPTLDLSPISKGIFYFFSSVGVVLFLVGLAVLVRFVRTYPVHEQSEVAE
jgi:hypothetical protein